MPRESSLVAGLLALFGAIGGLELWQYASLDGPIASDFFGLWSWSRFVATEGIAALYDPAAMHRYQFALDPFYVDQHYPFLYPPTYLLFLWPLAHLPLGSARLLWSTVTLSAYVAALCLPRPRKTLLVAAMVSPATVLCLICGQNGLLTAAFMIGGLRCATTRPIVAGALLGLLTYKPHLAALIPIALIAARLWTALAATAVISILCIAASAAVFGVQTWLDFLGAQRASWATIDAFISAHLAMIPTVSAALRQLGLSPEWALAGQFAAALFSIAALWTAWRSSQPLLAVPVAALLASPYAFLYDLPMLSGAALLALGERPGGPAIAFLGAALLLPQLMFDLPGAAVPLAAPMLALILAWLTRLSPRPLWSH